MAVEVYQFPVASVVFSPILLWYDMVIMQFFPIEEAFSTYFTDIILVLGYPSFIGK
jgi:hypothetical protein